MGTRTGRRRRCGYRGLHGDDSCATSERVRTSTPRPRRFSTAFADPSVLRGSRRRDLQAERLLDGRSAHGVPVRAGSRAAASAAAIRHARPGDRRSRVRAGHRDREAARSAASARPRRVRQHRPPPRARNTRVDRGGAGNPARLRLSGHGADQRRIRSRSRADDRLQPPREGDPLGSRRRPDARLRRPPPGRRGAAAGVIDQRTPRDEHSTTRVGRPPEPGARQRPARDATRHGVLVYGHLPPARITLRPWFRDRRLRRIATGAAAEPVGAAG